MAGEGTELPNGKGGKRKEALRQQQRPASPAVPASDGGSHVEGSVADDSLAVPGPSGLNARTVEIPPPVLAVEPAAMGEPAGEPAMEPAKERPPVPAAEQAAAAEPASELLSVSTVESVAVALATEPAVAVGLASESLSVLAVDPVAAVEPAAGPSAESAAEPAVESAAEPAVVIAAEPAAGPMAAGKGRPVLANGPVAATKECWVMIPVISPKVIGKRIREELAVVAAAEAAEAATPQERQAREPLSELGCVPAAGRAAAEPRTSPLAAAPRPAASAAAAQGKRKASAGVAEGSRTRKKSSPVKLKDLQ